MEARVVTFMFLSGSRRALHSKQEVPMADVAVWAAWALGLVLQPGIAGYLLTR